MISSSLGSIRNFWIVFIFLSSFVFAVPAVNLKGVDSVDSGAFNYSLALDVPPGVAGVAPQISLAYSSNSGNGYLGQGWSISGLSSISRCDSTQLYNRYNRAVRYDDRDRFCMDGQQLVKVDNNEYRTKIESYAKITTSGDEDNPDKFTVKMKSGDIYTYSYVDEIKGKNAVWYLTQISDRFKNSIDFYYLSGEFPTQLTEIRYSDVKIKFNYSGAREDTITAYSFGKKIVLDENLKDIQILVDNQYYKKYSLSYYDQENKERLKLKNIQECVSGGGCTNPLVFTWQGNNQVNPQFKTTQFQFPNNKVDKKDTKLADLNGDGFTDIYVTENKKGYVYL